MSLASLSAFVAGVGWLVVGTNLLLYREANTPSVHAESLLRLLHWLPSPQADDHMLLLAWLLGGAAMLAPPVALRRLGKALWLDPTLSPCLAQRFRSLAHALLFNLVGGWVATALAAAQSAQYRIGVGMGSWGLLIATLFAYIVAALIREGAAAATENREFV